MNIRVPTLLLAFGFFILFSANAKADGDQETLVASVAAGPTLSWGQCPCMRWSVRFKTLGGHWTVKNFILSSDSLFALEKKKIPSLLRATSKSYRFGAIQVASKAKKVGIGFEGITIGEDLDRGYSDILRTGLSVLLKLSNLTVKSGYVYESMQVNLAPQIVHHTLPQNISLWWSSGRWTATIATTVDLDATDLNEWKNPKIEGSGSIEARLLKVKDHQLSLGLAASAEHDPFRDIIGFEEDMAIGSIYMDLSWVRRRAK